jgi:hypothetical protein
MTVLCIWACEIVTPHFERSAHLNNISRHVSWALLISVRNCQTETTPRVEKKDLLGPDCWADSRVQSAAAQVDWVVGFIGGTIHQRWEGICFKEQLGCWALIVSGHQMTQVDMYRKLKNRNLLWLCKQGNFYKRLCFRGPG